MFIFQNRKLSCPQTQGLVFIMCWFGVWGWMCSLIKKNKTKKAIRVICSVKQMNCENIEFLLYVFDSLHRTGSIVICLRIKLDSNLLCMLYAVDLVVNKQYFICISASDNYLFFLVPSPVFNKMWKNLSYFFYSLVWPSLHEEMSD